MKIAIIKTTHQKYGGSIYENELAEILSKEFDVEFINVGVKIKSKLKYLEAPFVLRRLFEISKRKDFDLVIRNFEASLILNKSPTKNIVLVHHIDSSYSPIILRIFYPFFEKIIFHNLKKFDAIITVSKFWKDYFEGKGYRNIYLIYNAFDLDEFHFSSKEIKEFREKHGLTEKPIIYIGNCQKGKGVVETYQALKNLNVYLITSGEAFVRTPAINLNLEYRDHSKLLKASTIVVTMSKFKEGWCRTTHEAMLCKTPVIGSGLGGMSELLKGGNQIICKDFRFLKEKVAYLLIHPEIRKKMGEDGYNFAKNFTTEKFKEEWVKLIKNLF